MAGTLPATDILEMLILRHMFGTTAWTRPAAIYIGLFTAAASDTGGGTEVTGGSYARVQVSQADASWTGLPTAGAGTISNAGVITFPTATGTWGTVTHMGVFDALTVGTLLLQWSLTAPKPVATNDIFTFAIGALSITLD